MSEQALPEKVAPVEIAMPLPFSIEDVVEAQPAPQGAAAALVRQSAAPRARTVDNAPRAPKQSLPSVQELTVDHMRGNQQEGWPAFERLKMGSEAYGAASIETHARKSMSGQRTRQLLKHMSTALLTRAFGLGQNPVEIQCMWVKGRVVVAGNKAPAMEALYATLVGDTLLAAARNALATLTAPADTTPAARDRTEEEEERLEQARHVAKFVTVASTGRLRKPARDAMDAKDDSPEQRDARTAAELATLIAAAKEARLIEMVTSETKVAQRLADPRSAGHVLVLTGGVCTHAEQNLMRILMSLPDRPRVSIQGVKRSCTACSMCLRLLTRKLGHQIDFSDEPGAAFTEGFKQIDTIFRSHLQEMGVTAVDATTLDRMVRELIKELLPAKRHVSKMVKHVSTTLDTLSDSEDER